MRFASIALVLVFLAVAGCGDGGPSEEEFTADVQAVCDDAATQLQAKQSGLVEAFGDPRNFSAYYSKNVAPIVDSMLDDLDAIEAPDEKSEDWDALLANFRETTELIADDPAVLLGGGKESREAAQRVQELSAEGDALASDLGLPQGCGQAAG